MRTSIADYRPTRQWGDRPGRYVAAAPDRLGVGGEVMVSEVDVDAAGWQALQDRLLRLARLPGGGLLQPFELLLDLETGRVFVVTEMADEPPPLPCPPTAGRSLAALAAAARAVHNMHESGLAHGSLWAGALLHCGRGPVLDLPLLDPQPGELARPDGWRQVEALAPDLLAGDVPSRASDIWSLGATLHAILSDRPLYPGMEDDDTVSALQRVMFTRPQPDARIAAPHLALIEECLCPDPASRPAGAGEVADRIEAAGATGP